MHSLLFRANAVVTFGITILAILCALASVTDSFHRAEPSAEVQILGVESFLKLPGGNDEARLILSISADLQSVFTWNTKQLFVFLAAEYETPDNPFNQISLWDAIVEKKEDAKILRRTRTKYPFVDQGNNLRGLEFNLTLYWNVMPVTGRMFTDKKVITGYRLPKQYR